MWRLAALLVLLQGVCHRDLKLENTLLDGSPAPRVKICDFGYSKSVLDSQPKSTVGTPAYIAPEVRATGCPACGLFGSLASDKTSRYGEADMLGMCPWVQEMCPNLHARAWVQARHALVLWLLC